VRQSGSRLVGWLIVQLVGGMDGVGWLDGGLVGWLFGGWVGALNWNWLVGG
jgi:hypothetical protein